MRIVVPRQPTTEQVSAILFSLNQSEAVFTAQQAMPGHVTMTWSGTLARDFVPQHEYWSGYQGTEQSPPE